MKGAALRFSLSPLWPRGPSDLAGHYVLHMMEAGSELLLKSDGTFEFGLIYGAADYWAKRAWHRDGSYSGKLGQGRASLSFAAH